MVQVSRKVVFAVLQCFPRRLQLFHMTLQSFNQYTAASVYAASLTFQVAFSGAHQQLQPDPESSQIKKIKHPIMAH